MQPCCCIDARDPQRTKLAFALPAIPVGILACLYDSLFCCFEKFAASAVIALGFAEDFLMTRFGDNATFYSRQTALTSASAT
jgi:hypothetical protein